MSSYQDDLLEQANEALEVAIAAIETGSLGTHATDIEVTDSAKGLILKSPDASRWRITVDNAGALVITEI